MASSGGDVWDALWSRFESLRASISKSKARNVNTASLRNAAKESVQLYFRNARPELAEIGMKPEDLKQLDGYMQELLRLASGNNLKGSYLTTIASIRRIRSELDIHREMLLGRKVSDASSSFQQSGNVDGRILATLSKLLPSAADSYKQAIDDLRGPKRSSYRGTALEIREALREILDHLAPDDAVTKSAGFVLERDRLKPTMRQKARFILTSRSASDSSLASAQHTVTLIDESTAALTRTLYERGSVATHVATTAREVQKLKLYCDAILAEILEIF
jgi:Predicted pPIWI-associating nuclease